MAGRSAIGVTAIAALMFLCCSGVAIVGSGLAFVVGSCIGGVALGTTAAVIGLGTALVLWNRRRCRGVRQPSTPADQQAADSYRALARPRNVRR
jgi:hypothetical protein